MEKIEGFPFYPIEITKDGKVYNAEQRTALLDALKASDDPITDLMVVSHGWNNDTAEARALYDELFKNAAKLLTGPRTPASRKIAIAGIFWPSKKFAEEDLIPAKGGTGGTASIIPKSVPNEGLVQKLDKLKDKDDESESARQHAQALDKAKTLIDKLQDDPATRNEFAELVKSVLPTPVDTVDDASPTFFKRSGDQLLTALVAPVRQKPVSTPGMGGTAALQANGPAGGAAGLGEVLSGMKAAAWRLLNYATYYQMKERAGVVGTGVNGLLKEVRTARNDLRIHLIGHSFGGRVMAAAAKGPAAVKPSSLTLLQAAFSHNGFASGFGEHKQNGFFCDVVSKKGINGPIIVTHTGNDRAVGLAYPIASRIAGDNQAAIGDANDPYGGIGRNGAINMAKDQVIQANILDEKGVYTFTSGVIHNLEAGTHIKDHGDVENPEVANVVLAAAGF